MRAQVRIGTEEIEVATTHFLWHNSIVPSLEQLGAYYNKLAPILRRNPRGILAGDFNTSRGYKIYNDIGEIFTDNIPDLYSTFDSIIKPKATWPGVVDGFFTGDDCRVIDIRMVRGLSDHQGVLAQVQRVASL